VAFRDARAKYDDAAEDPQQNPELGARVSCRTRPAERGRWQEWAVAVGVGSAESGAGARQGCYTGTVSVCADCGAIAMLRNYRRGHRKVIFGSPVIFY
jgi:hypothetical protein